MNLQVNGISKLNIIMGLINLRTNISLSWLVVESNATGRDINSPYRNRIPLNCDMIGLFSLRSVVCYWVASYC